MVSQLNWNESICSFHALGYETLTMTKWSSLTLLSRLREGWVGGGVCCTGYHQCPDSSPAADRHSSLDIVTLVWFFPSNPCYWFFRLVMGSQSGIGCSNELANFLSTSRGGGIRMIKVRLSQSILASGRSLSMIWAGTNILLLLACPRTWKQMGGFWELGGRLGSLGFKGSSGLL